MMATLMSTAVRISKAKTRSGVIVLEYQKMNEV
jgi:hypothetical protein